eukprot:2133471-Alexandrium_andersonii.AAC.1
MLGGATEGRAAWGCAVGNAGDRAEPNPNRRPGAAWDQQQQQQQQQPSIGANAAVCAPTLES